MLVGRRRWCSRCQVPGVCVCVLSTGRHPAQPVSVPILQPNPRERHAHDMRSQKHDTNILTVGISSTPELLLESVLRPRTALYCELMWEQQQQQQQLLAREFLILRGVSRVDKCLRHVRHTHTLCQSVCVGKRKKWKKLRKNKIFFFEWDTHPPKALCEYS